MLSPPSPAQEPVEPIGDADAGADEEPEEDSEDGGSGSGSENEDSVVEGGVEDVPPKDSPRPTSQPLFPTSPSIPPTELEFSPPKNEVIEIKDTPMKAEPETMDVVDASEVPNPKPELGGIPTEESQDVAEPSSSKGDVKGSKKTWVDNFYSKLTATDEWKKARLAELTKQLANAKKEMTAAIFDLH